MCILKAKYYEKQQFLSIFQNLILYLDILKMQFQKIIQMLIKLLQKMQLLQFFNEERPSYVLGYLTSKAYRELYANKDGAPKAQ